MRILTAMHTIDCPLCWSEHVEGLRFWVDVSILEVKVRIDRGREGTWHNPPTMPEVEDAFVVGGTQACDHEGPTFEEAVYEKIMEAFGRGDIEPDHPRWTMV